MTDLRTAAQQALEAMDKATRFMSDSDYKKLNEAIDDLRAALAEPCPCDDRPAAQCPGEWEPGCDLGNNPKYAKRVEMTPKELAASIKRGEKWKVAEPGSLMIAAQQFLEWNRAQSPPPVTVGFELGVFEAVKKAYPFPPQRPAEPVQEPVAWRFEARHIDSAWAAAVTLKHPGAEGVHMRNVTPLYAAPQRKPLTDQAIWREYQGLWPFHPAETPALANDILKFARALERAHGIT